MERPPLNGFLGTRPVFCVKVDTFERRERPDMTTKNDAFRRHLLFGCY